MELSEELGQRYQVLHIHLPIILWLLTHLLSCSAIHGSISNRLSVSFAGAHHFFYLFNLVRRCRFPHIKPLQTGEAGNEAE
jgi:hypothetical protein